MSTAVILTQDMIQRHLSSHLQRIKALCVISICASVILLGSCNGSSNSANEDATAQKTGFKTVDGDKVFPISIQKGGSFRSLEQIRVQALTIINDREEPEAFSIITAGYWHPEAVVNGRDIRGQGYYEGYWIKFEDDFSYRYGVYGDLLGSGKYHFRLEEESLIMLDNDFEQEPKVWSAKANGRAIALAGRHDYQVNNGIQMKLIYLDNQPKK